MSFIQQRNKNELINGNMDVGIQGATYTTPNDDTYILDNWNNLQEANSAWTFSQSTDAPYGSKFSLKCVNITLNNQCGIVQLVRNKTSIPLDNGPVSLSFEAKTTTAKEISNLRATVLSWSSTDDVVTSDVVGTWASDGTDPTWAANWTAEVAGSDLALTTAFKKFTINNINIDTASMANLAVVVWTDDGTIAAGDEFYITQCKLERGVVATEFEARSFPEELMDCQMSWEQSYSYGVAPGTATSSGAHTFVPCTTYYRCSQSFRVEKWSAPTMIYYNPNDGSTGTWRDQVAAADRAVANWNVSTGQMSSSVVTVDTNVTVGHWTADNRL